MAEDNTSDNSLDDLDLDGWTNAIPADPEPEPDPKPDPKAEAEEPEPEPEPKAEPEPEPKPAAAAKPKRTRAKADASAPKSGAGTGGGRSVTQSLRTSPKVSLKIHEMENPPVGGVPVSVNGYMYRIQPGQWVDVPEAVVEVLEHAQETKAVMDHKGTIIGHRTVPRFSYSTRPTK